MGFIVLGASMYLYADTTSDSSDGFVKIWEKSVESEIIFSHMKQDLCQLTQRKPLFYASPMM